MRPIGSSSIVRDFLDGERTYGLDRLYQQTRVKKQMWQFGLRPSQVAAFIGEYSWTELEQVGADEYRQRYLAPMGRTDAVMEIERTVHAEKLVNQPLNSLSLPMSGRQTTRGASDWAH